MKNKTTKKLFSMFVSLALMLSFFPMNIVSAKDDRTPINSISITSDPLKYIMDGTTPKLVNVDGNEATPSDIVLENGANYTVSEIGIFEDVGICGAALIVPKDGYVFEDGFSISNSDIYMSGYSGDIDNKVMDEFTAGYFNEFLPSVKEGDIVVCWSASEYTVPACKIGSTGYDSVEDAIMAAGKSETTIVLLKDVSKDVTIYSEQNIKFELNDHQITGNLNKNGDNPVVTFIIKSETDLNNAANIKSPSSRHVWDIQEDITLTRFVKISDRYLIINGNDHTITGASGEYDDPSKTLQMFAIDSGKSTFKNIVKINDLKIVGSERFKNVIAVQNKDESTNKYGINLKLSNVEIDQTSLRDGGAPILNLGSEITIKDNFKVTTGETSCYAIGVDLATQNATLTIDDDAVVTFVDNRSETQKADRALIFISSRDSGNSATVSGKFVTDNMDAVTEETTTKGYNLKYSITKEAAINGSYTVSKEEASIGTEITVVPTADSNYEIDKVCWKKASDSNYTEIEDNDGYKFTMPGCNVVVMVTFKASIAVVTFDSNEGSAVDSQTVYKNALVDEPTNPTKTDSTFGGWHKEAELINKWDFSNDKVTSDMTLYAKWIKIISESDSTDIPLVDGKAYKEFTKSNTSTSTLHIQGLTLDDVYTEDTTHPGLVVMNGTTILNEGADKDYTLTEGSLKVNLNKSYLDTLAAGTHTINVYVNKATVPTTDSYDYMFDVIIKINEASSSGTTTYNVVNTSTGSRH